MKIDVLGAPRHSFDKYACNSAISYGNLDYLKYLHENGTNMFVLFQLVMEI